MLTAPDHNAHLLFPLLCVAPERAAAPTGDTAYAAGWDVLFSFSSSFCNMLSTHQYTSFMPSFMSCFGSTSCSMTPYSHLSAISSLSPHLSSCTFITTGTRIPTYPFTYWCPKTVCNSFLWSMQQPLQFLGHPAAFPSNSFGHALPHEQEESEVSFLTVERKSLKLSLHRANSTAQQVSLRRKCPVWKWMSRST